jgi:type II secretory pathway pseudopilin PulG
MKRRSYHLGFSLVEVTLALGITGVSLLVVLGLLPSGTSVSRAATQSTKANLVAAQVMNFLRSDVVLPPGQASKAQGSWANLHGNWANQAHPDSLYFTNEVKQTGNANPGSVPTDAAFVANMKYIAPPTVTTSVCRITVAWPAAAAPVLANGDLDMTNVAGSIELFVTVNR